MDISPRLSARACDIFRIMRAMRKLNFAHVLLVVLGALLLFGFVGMQDTQITRPKLREMLVELGYEVTDLVKDEGKEKVSVTFVRNGLNVPVGFEISPSNSYIWLTVNLGPAPAEGSAKCLNLLKQNSKIQPTFFYVTDSGNLMAAQAIENRAVTIGVLRLRAEFVADNIGKSKDAWQ